MLAGNWSILMGRDLYRQTIGIIGLGRIGRSLVQRLSGFEANVLVVDSQRDNPFAEASGVTYVDLETLLRRSDYVTVHAPLTPETRFMLNAETIAKMKKGAFLINAARGGLVDDRALLDALKSGHLAGAGLDTFVSESDPQAKAVTDELISLPNVIATPHAAASTREGLDRTNLVAAQCVVAVLDGDTPPAATVVADGRRSGPKD